MKKVYESTQIFVNFILESKWADLSFREKMKNNEKMRFYLADKNKNKFSPEVNIGLQTTKYLLKPMPFRNLLADFGHFCQIDL